MKRMAAVVVIIVCLVLTGMAIAFFHCSAKGGLETEVLASLNRFHPELGGGIYKELAVWKRALGEPRTVPQADGGSTYFYWPKTGIAVFTHPLYEGQYQRRPEDERIVTSVIIPLEQRVHPNVPPVGDAVFIEFERLLPLDTHEKNRPDISPEALLNILSNRPSRHSGDVIEIPGRCGGFSRTIILLHLVKGRVVEIEVRDGWLFSRYD